MSTTSTERVCVVAGAAAWPFYLATGAWIGPENRRFVPLAERG